MTQVTREEVQATFNRLLEGAVDRVLESFARQPTAATSIEEAVRWDLIATGEAIDGAALVAKLRETEPEIEIEACGINREMGYIWARIDGGEANRDPETWVIPANYFRYVSLLSGNLMGAPTVAPDDAMPMAEEVT